MAGVKMNFNFLSDMGMWPQSYIDQQFFVQTLLSNLQLQYQEQRAAMHRVFTVESTTEPDWLTQWISKTGLTYIPENVLLVWTKNNVVQEVYVYANGAIRQFAPNGVAGLLNTLETSYNVTTRSYDSSILTTTDRTSLTFTLPYDSTVEILYFVNLDFTAGTGEIGVDFQLDGDKLGTSLFSIPNDEGIFSRSTDGPLYVPLTLDSVSAGGHTLQVLLGRETTSTAEVTIGTTGHEILIVKGYTK